MVLSSIKRLLESFGESYGTDADKAGEHGLQLAAAALLLEVSSADFKHHPEEKAAVLRALNDVFSLSDDEKARLYEHAATASDQAVSLYEFTSVINSEWTHEQKCGLLEQMWRVAFADGRLDKYEDHRIRRIADLLHLPHREFIRCKHLAES